MRGASALLVPRTRKDLRYWILCDLAAHGLSEWRAGYRRTHPVVHYQVLRRRAEYWSHGTDRRGSAAAATGAATLLAARTRSLGRRLGLDVPLGTTGPGLLLANRGDHALADIWVHPNARLGAHCTLHAGSTIDATSDGRAALLGEYCQVGEGATVLGAHLGNRVTIAPETVVTDDFADDTALAGNPAKSHASLAGTPERRRDGRRTTMTSDQVHLARQLHAGGDLDTGAIADAFWVSPSTLEKELADIDTHKEGLVAGASPTVAGGEGSTCGARTESGGGQVFRVTG